MLLKLILLKNYLLRHDLLMHFFLGFFIFMLSSQFTSLTVALIITTVAGILKELVWDLWWKKGTPEFIDVVYTILPAIVLILLR